MAMVAASYLPASMTALQALRLTSPLSFSQSCRSSARQASVDIASPTRTMPAKSDPRAGMVRTWPPPNHDKDGRDSISSGLDKSLVAGPVRLTLLRYHFPLSEPHAESTDDHRS